MEEEQTKASTNKTTQKEQKKSEKDKNGIIGGLVFGAMAVFATYQIYDKFFEFAIGKILVYILGVLAFICFAVSISSFFDFKESKKLEKLDEDVRREEKEFSEINPEKRALRAEKMFRMNQKELMRYYDMNLAQTKFLSGLGIMMILFGILNILGVKKAGIVQTILAALLGISVVTLTIAALVSSKTSLSNMAPWWGFHKSDAIAPWAYVGFDTIPQAAEEFKFSYKKVS